jgi:thiaminase
MQPPAKQTPSLVTHLLNKFSDKFNVATQQSFLSHAGCGTLSHPALSSWLIQHGHISRAMIAAIGSLIAKLSLPEAANTRAATPYRTLDLLISTISNLRKEIDFIENTKRKYHLDAMSEPPSPMARAYVDLLASTSEPRADLLEGMVALWATEHVSLSRSPIILPD